MIIIVIAFIILALVFLALQKRMNDFTAESERTIELFKILVAKNNEAIAKGKASGNGNYIVKKHKRIDAGNIFDFRGIIKKKLMAKDDSYKKIAEQIKEDIKPIEDFIKYNSLGFVCFWIIVFLVKIYT